MSLSILVVGLLAYSLLLLLAQQVRKLYAGEDVFDLMQNMIIGALEIIQKRGKSNRIYYQGAQAGIYPYKKTY